MVKPFKTPTTYNCDAIYQHYVAKLLKRNPDYLTRNISHCKNAVVYKVVAGLNIEVMSYKLFRVIQKAVNTKIRDKVIDGGCYQLGSGLGYINMVQIERFPDSKSKHAINWAASLPYKNKDKTYEKIVYYDVDYVRVAWTKTSVFANRTVYEFKPGRASTGEGFKNIIVKRLREDTLLITKYPFISRKENILRLDTLIKKRKATSARKKAELAE